jgi:hypothetical protein
MSPQLNTDPRSLARHPQRPWRPVEIQPRRQSRAVERTFCAPVVREIPPRVAQRDPLGTW